MKKFLTLLLFLVFVIAACAPAAPVQPAEPQVVVVTVEVPAAPAAAPTDVPVAAPTNAPPTEAPTAAPATEAPTVAPTATSQPAVGGDVFAEFYRSGERFSLKCSPSELTFTVKSLNLYIKKVELYYYMTDQLNNIDSKPYSAGFLEAQGGDVFSIVLSALDVNPDVRFEKGWFNYQFVGINKTGDVVGRSEMFKKLVTFTLNCP